MTKQKIVFVQLYSWGQVMIDRENKSRMYNTDSPAQLARAERLAEKVNPPVTAGEQGTDQETCTAIISHRDLIDVLEYRDWRNTRQSVDPYHF